MATLNAATCYHLKDVGGLAPGKKADFIVFKNLKHIEPVEVYKDGVLVAKNDKPLFENHVDIPSEILNTVKFSFEDLSFDLPLASPNVHVIGLVKHNIITKDLIEHVSIKNGLFEYQPKQDILKLAVIERHHFTKCVGVGLVKGFHLNDGAIAMTIAHDSHNLIVVGTSDEDMKLAAKKIQDLQGGIVIVRHHQVEDYLQLEISGIMTNQDESVVETSLSRMKKTVIEMGFNPEMGDPFIARAFLA